MAWRFYAIDATVPPCSARRFHEGLRNLTHGCFPTPTARFPPGCCTDAECVEDEDGPKLDATSSPNTSRSKEVSAAGKNRQRLEPQTFTDHEKLLTTSQCSFVRVPAAPKYLCGNQIVAARLRHD